MAKRTVTVRLTEEQQQRFDLAMQEEIIRRMLADSARCLNTALVERIAAQEALNEIFTWIDEHCTSKKVRWYIFYTDAETELEVTFSRLTDAVFFKLRFG